MEGGHDRDRDRDLLERARRVLKTASYGLDAFSRELDQHLRPGHSASSATRREPKGVQLAPRAQQGGADAVNPAGAGAAPPDRQQPPSGKGKGVRGQVFLSYGRGDAATPFARWAKKMLGAWCPTDCANPYFGGCAPCCIHAHMRVCLCV